MSNPISTYTSQYSGDNVMRNVPLASGAYKTFADGFKLAGAVGKGDGESAASDVTSVASDVTGFASDAVSAASDPLGFLISKGLGFLENVFSPLKEELQLVTGDPTTLSSCAQKFDGVANSLNQLAAQVEQTALAGGQSWQGDTSAAAGQQIATTKQSIEDTATSAGHIASLLQISSMLMQAAYDIINGIIASVVEQVVITWIAAQAAAAFTFGASEAAAGAATVGEVAEGTAEAGSKVEETSSLLSKIINVLKKIMAQIKEIGSNLRHPLQTFMEEGGKGAKALEDVSTEGKTASQIFNEAISKNLTGSKIAEMAGDSALGEIGLPSKSNLDDPSQMSTLDAISAGTNLVNKDWGWGDKAAKAVVYGADPGAYTTYENNVSGTDATPAPTSQPPTQPQQPGSVQPIPSWPSDEPDGGNVEPI